jgi:hypothetical protein
MTVTVKFEAEALTLRTEVFDLFRPDLAQRAFVPFLCPVRIRSNGSFIFPVSALDFRHGYHLHLRRLLFPKF